jgi:hypothetical protein
VIRRTVTDPDDVDQEHVVEDLVHDPIVADADPVHRVLTLHRDAVGRPRIASEKIEGGADPLLLATLEGRQ